jgi:hypothetical protein
MSDESTHNEATPPAMCDRLLDFVYGELDEAGKREFEAHLATCARCQSEAASFGRSRQAARHVMPSVEPPANLTGALHAQLMHAASQRRPKRGVVLQLFRRVAQHPQMAAAAMFVIVGGAFVFSWRKAKLFPPAQELAAPASTPVVAAPAPEPIAADDEDGAEAGNALAANKNLPAAGLGSAGKLGHFKGGKDAPSGAAGEKVVLATPTAKYDVTRAAAPPKPAMHAAKSRALRSDNDGVLGGFADSSGGDGYGKREAAKSSAPSDIVAEERKDAYSSRGAADAPAKQAYQAGGGVSNGYAQAPAPKTIAPSAPPPPAAAAPMQSIASSTGSVRDEAKSEQQAVRRPTTAAQNVEAARKHFDELARGNRCDDAIKTFRELERATSVITPTERAQYAHCLMQKGRQQEAEQQLLDLKADKRVTNADVDKLQQEIGASRAKKKSAKPAAADDRVAQPQSENAAPAPEEKAPQPPPPQQQKAADKPAL